MMATRRRLDKEPIMTAPRDQGRMIEVLWEGQIVNVWWWRHWSMAEGVWWSPIFGAITPKWWLP